MPPQFKPLFFALEQPLVGFMLSFAAFEFAPLSRHGTLLFFKFRPFRLQMFASLFLLFRPRLPFLSDFQANPVALDLFSFGGVLHPFGSQF